MAMIVPWKAEFERILKGVVVEQIAKGKIITWCNRCMEWGPWALGCRSIIADVHEPGVS